MNQYYKSKNRSTVKTVITVIAVLLLCAICVGIFVQVGGGHHSKPVVPSNKYVAYEPTAVGYNAGFGANFENDYPINVLTRVDTLSVAPYAYSDTSLFAGKRITKISVPVATVSAVDANQYFTLWVVKADNVKVGGVVDTTSAKTYKVYLPETELTSTTVDKWITVDLADQFIYVGEDETLAFMKSDDPVVCRYGTSSAYKFIYNLLSSGQSNSYSIFYGVWTDDVVSLAGKTISILGDSISTYQGYSNDSSTTNDSIGSNAVYFPKYDIDNVNETWWKQAIDATGMQLLVNNSWSGSRVFNNDGAAYLTRCTQLHDNTGSNSGTEPDIIAVYMGVNDFNGGVALGSFEALSDIYSEEDGYITPTNFAQAYAIMMHKLVSKYDNAEVYVFTLPYNGKRTDTAAMDSYNEMIRYIAKYFECQIVDLANIEGYDYATYTSDYLHPNEQGMDLITDLFVRMLNSVSNS